jgi:hypothetical protein
VPIRDPCCRQEYHWRHGHRALQCPVSSKRRAKVIKIRDGTEVAARHFVYKLYDTTGGEAKQWQLLHGMEELAVTISRAVSVDGSSSRGASRGNGRLR